MKKSKSAANIWQQRTSRKLPKSTATIRPFSSRPKVIAMILAAGNSQRFGENKLAMPVLGKPILYYSLQAFHDHPLVDDLLVVTSKNFKKEVQAMIEQYHFPKIKAVVEGGTTRQESFFKGFRALTSLGKKIKSSQLHQGLLDDTSIILVHNAANPLVMEQEITATISAVKKHGAAAVARKIVDTVKEIRGHHYVKTLDRENLRAAQTPQGARYELFAKAVHKAETEGAFFTDETSLIENLGTIKVAYVPASPNNFKITTREDYALLKTLMGDTPEDFLVGIGQDSHEFDPSKKGLTLGGVHLPKEPKLSADSDGDVLLHALGNALLQAIGEQSLGSIATPLFKEKNIRDSRIYLQHILKKITRKKYILNNLGLMLEGKRPHFDNLSLVLRQSLSRITNLPIERIGITATSGKRLTAFGEGKGIQCFAIVSLRRDGNAERNHNETQPMKKAQKKTNG